MISEESSFNPKIVNLVIGGNAKITVAMTPALAPTPQNIATKIRYEKCGKDCKILTGSSYVVNTSILENSFFLIEGKVSIAKLTAGSGKPCKVYFCNSCGVFIYADYDTAVGRLTVRTKTFVS